MDEARERRNIDARRLAGGRFACRPQPSRAQARKILDAVLEEICESLAQGEAVKLQSFGAFKLRSKRRRIGRNPETGVEAPITPRRVLTFKPAPALVARVNAGTLAGGEER